MYLVKWGKVKSKGEIVAMSKNKSIVIRYVVKLLGFYYNRSSRKYFSPTGNYWAKIFVV